LINQRQLPQVDFESGEKEPSPIRKLHLIPLLIGILGFSGLYVVVVYSFSYKLWEPPLYGVLIPEILIYIGLTGCFLLLAWDLKRRDDIGIGIIAFGLMFYFGLIFILPYIAIWTGPDRRDSLSEIVTILRQPLTERRLQAELPNVRESTHLVFFTDSPTRITLTRIRELENHLRRISQELKTPLPPGKIKIYLPAKGVRLGVNRGSIYAESYEQIPRYLVHMMLYLGPGYTPVQILYEGIGRALDGRDVDEIHKEARDTLKTGTAPPLSYLIPYRRWHNSSADELERAKRLSGSFVRYLIDRKGIDSFKSLFGRVTERSVKKRFKRLYGSDFQSFEKKWLTFIATQYCGVPLEQALDQPWLNLQLLKVDAFEDKDKVQPQAYVNLGMAPERRWATLGLVKGKEADEIEREFAVPTDADMFHARFGELRETRWRRHNDRREDGLITYRMKNGHFGYAFIFVTGQEERDGMLRFGCEGEAKVYLNGRLILQAKGHEVQLDGETVPIKLNPGRNPILIRITGEKRASFILRLTDSYGERLEGVRFESPLD
jgi:hypothetical protein